MAISPDGAQILTASFDNTVGLWSSGAVHASFLEGHDAAVNVVKFAGPAHAISAGDDFSIRLWDLETGQELHQFDGHRGKIQALAISNDARLIASASWDGTAAVWDTASGKLSFELKGHAANVNDVVILSTGDFITASSDGTIRTWDHTGAQKRILVRHGFGINTLSFSEVNGWLAYGAVDGGTRVIDLETSKTIADLTLERRPVLAMAASPDKSLIAVGDGQGFIMIVDTSNWSIVRDFHAAKNGPVWALGFSADGSSILAGGIDDAAYFFPMDGDNDVQMSKAKRDFHRDPQTMNNGERQFRRKCSVCHTLRDADARRAGPSLSGIFGRKAGKLEGYSFSNAMLGSDIIWSAETIDKLFDLGPETYVPGSKMPMQRMNSAQDRRDLIEFLRDNTGP